MSRTKLGLERRERREEERRDTVITKPGCASSSCSACFAALADGAMGGRERRRKNSSVVSTTPGASCGQSMTLKRSEGAVTSSGEMTEKNIWPAVLAMEALKGDASAGKSKKMDWEGKK